MKVCHVSPTYFSPASIVGGGERFAEELARALSKAVEVRFVSFGRRFAREILSPTHERVILRNWTGRLMTPFSPRLFRELHGADVVHCHQYHSLPTFLAALQGRLQRSRVFVTDLGGGGFTPGYQIDQSRWISAHLPLSEYAARHLPGRSRPALVVFGGVDPERFAMRAQPTHDGSLVFLGRVLPHKGIHDAIAALPPDATLHVLGPTPDSAYLERLRGLARGKDVRFRTDLSDVEVVGFLQRALALLHPTPVDATGSAGANELFGLALAEAMACGCPVIATRAASLPEIVVDGTTGILVPPGDPAALRDAIERLRRQRVDWPAMSTAARRRVEERFTWDAVAGRCLEAYGACGY